MQRQVPTIQTAQNQRQVPVIQKAQTTAEVPQALYSGLGTNCGADRARASRDSTSAGSAAHRRVRIPVTAPAQYETDEVSEKSATLSQTKADFDELKPDCMNSGSTHADRT